MAQQVRYDRGPCEVEVCSCIREEADLQRSLIMCNKNPGHKSFIPVFKFTSEDLPEGYQDSCLVELINVLSDLTVRVAVRHTSDSRPQTYPDSDLDYPFYDQINSNRTRTGSGWVWNVERFSQMYDQRTCPCETCNVSLKPKSNWAEIIIASAAHVVFDDNEGRHTTCHLFYDKGSTPESCPGVVTLTGMSRVDRNIKEDKCKMTYVTHDMELADRLEKLTKRFMDLQKELHSKYNCNEKAETKSRNVSCDRSRVRNVTRYRSQPRYVEIDRSQQRIVDSKRSNPGKKVDSERSQPINISLDFSQPKIIDSESVQMRNISPDNLQRCNLIFDRSRSKQVKSSMLQCKTISSHKHPSEQVTSVRLHTLSFLPQSITVTPCQLHSKHVTHDKSQLRNVSPDKSQLQSIVTDRSRQRQPTCHLPQIRNITSHGSQSKSVTSDRVEQQNITSDRLIQRNVAKNGLPNCSVKTTELQLKNLKIDQSQSRFDTSIRAQPKLIALNRPDLPNVDSENDTDSSLTVIVSHPHGCNKQVTVGRYIQRMEITDSRNLTKYVYTTATCPGSSGAPVYVLGRWRGWWPCDHPHSGSSEVSTEINFSGVGLH